MTNANRFFRSIVGTAALAVFAFLAAPVNGAEEKFRTASSQEPVIGRYLVTLDGSVEADVAVSSAEALARPYGGQLEPYASGNPREFAMAMLPSRARSLSGDPRVREVVEVPGMDNREAPPPAPPFKIAPPHLVPVGQQFPSPGVHTYDGSGNIKSIGNDAFLYDVEERLVDAVVRGNEQSYTYDIYGNRTGAPRALNAIACLGGTTCEAAVELSENPSTTNHLLNVSYDAAGNVLAGYGATYVYDGTGMVTQASVGSDIRSFAYTADDERIAVKRGSSWTWTVRDQGEKVLREFTSLETTNPFNGNLGRFLSVDANFADDTLRNPQKWNRYAYAENNPLNYIDPNGKDALAVFLTGDERYRKVSTWDVIVSRQTITDVKHAWNDYVSEPIGKTEAYGYAAILTASGAARIGTRLLAWAGIGAGATAITATQGNISLIEDHLASLGPSAANTAMLDRLRSALGSGQPLTGADLNFYLHEVAEANLVQQGVAQEMAHQLVLEQQGVSPYSLYAPEVIRDNFELFNKNWLEYWDGGQ